MENKVFHNFINMENETTLHEGQELKKAIKGAGYEMNAVADLLKMTRQNLNHHLRKEKLDENFSALVKEKVQLGFTSGKRSSLQKIPVYNTRASAGTDILFQDHPELVVEYVDIPFIGKADGVIEVVGDSMYPTYANGTRIAVRKLADKQLIYFGECYYIIDANYDGRVKRLFASDKPNHLILRSDNKEYPDVEMHWNKINAVCKILCRIIKN